MQKVQVYNVTDKIYCTRNKIKHIDLWGFYRKTLSDDFACQKTPIWMDIASQYLADTVQLVTIYIKR